MQRIQNSMLVRRRYGRPDGISMLSTPCGNSELNSSFLIVGKTMQASPLLENRKY